MNWGRWIVERIPNRLRTVILFTLCMVYTAFIRKIYDEFIEWRRKMKIQMSGSPQVCMLKKVIYDELGINIEIEEGNGKPYDFIITTAFSDVDKERQLFALLDRYKLAGKSYSYANAEVALSCEWGGYVCEVQTLFVAWSEYVCEIRPRVVNYISASIYSGRIHVKLDYPPTSNIRVVYVIYRDNGSGGIEVVCDAIFNISKGETKELSMPWSGSDDWRIIEIQQSVYNDNYYIYRTQWLPM
nr:MAG TPA: hypothetical protein [Caudoviricetes sp.]